MAVTTLAAEMTFLHVFLGVIPSSSGICHEDSQHKAGCQTADEQTQDACYAEYQTGDDRYDDRQDRRQ